MYAQVFAHRAVKINAVVLAALLVTFMLFYFMQLLISVDDAPGPKFTITKFVDNTMPVFESILIEEIEPPLPLEEVVPPEIELAVRQTSQSANSALTTPWTAPATPGLHVTQIPLSSNIMIPLIRTTAAYPSRALANGVEGYVELSFTVNELGNVQDAVVLYAEPEGYFERAALQTIQRWKYAAAVEQGEPVPTHDVRQRIVFQIDPATR